MIVKDIDTLLDRWVARLAEAAVNDARCAGRMLRAARIGLVWSLPIDLAPGLARPAVVFPRQPADPGMQVEFVKLAAAAARQRVGHDRTLGHDEFLLAQRLLVDLERDVLSEIAGAPAVPAAVAA